MSTIYNAKATFARYWHGSSGDSSVETLYVGYHKASSKYRSRIQFNTANWNWGEYNVSDITILSAKLKLYPRGFYADTVRTANTWIAMSLSTTSSDTECNAAYNLGIINNTKPLNNGKEHALKKESYPTIYTFNSDFLTRLEEYCKNESVFSIFIGGVQDVQGVIFTSYNPQGVSKSFVPVLEVEYAPSASTGTITTKREDHTTSATVTINKLLKTYTHKIVWTFNSKTVTYTNKNTSSSSVTNTFTIKDTTDTSAENKLVDYFGQSVSKITGKCKIITYADADQTKELGSKEISVTLQAPKVADISWSTTPYLSADNYNGRHEDFEENTTLFVKGYSRPKIYSGKAASKTGASISEYYIKINSCGINIEQKINEDSSTLIDKAISSSTTDSSLTAEVYVIDSRGAKSSAKTLYRSGETSKPTCYSYSPPYMSSSETPQPIRVVGFKKVAEGKTGAFELSNGVFIKKNTTNGYYFDTTPDEEGQYIFFTGTFKKSSLNGVNIITSSTIQFKEKGDETKQLFPNSTRCASIEKVNFVASSADNVNYTSSYYREYTYSNDLITGVKYYIPAKTEQIYSLTHTIYDYPKYGSYSYEVQSTNYIIHIRKGGKSLGLGAASLQAENTIYCGWEMRLKEPLGFPYGGTGCISAQGLSEELSTYLMPLRGGTMTGNLTISRSGSSGGIYLKDSTGATPGALYYNGTNLWIGSTESATAHHRGGTYISTGYNGTEGNDSIYVSIPNSSNNGSSSYKVYHAGNVFYSAANASGAPSSIPGGTAQAGMIWLCPVD